MQPEEEQQQQQLQTSAPSPPPPTDDDMDGQEQDTLDLTLHYHNQPITLSLPSNATISDLSILISTDLSIPPETQKFLVSPKPGLLRPPFKDPNLALATLVPPAARKTKITLLGTTSQELATQQAEISALQAKQAARAAALRAGRKAQSHRRRVVDNSARAQEAATYTFAALRALPHLPRPDKALRFLERLRDDPGVRAAMRKHRFAVGLLTEMDPAMHTTHESRTLGLNRNRGEVIELRLRTDAYDGYRDYKTIRKTLAHELAHNVVGPHNNEFHALWNEIEKEIDRNDYLSGGRSVGGPGADEFYNPGDRGVDVDFEADEGGWEGGSYVLGGGDGAGQTMSRREVIAKAAEARMKQQSKANDGGDGGSATG